MSSQTSASHNQAVAQLQAPVWTLNIGWVSVHQRNHENTQHSVTSVQQAWYQTAEATPTDHHTLYKFHKTWITAFFSAKTFWLTCFSPLDDWSVIGEQYFLPVTTETLVNNKIILQFFHSMSVRSVSTYWWMKQKAGVPRPHSAQLLSFSQPKLAVKFIHDLTGVYWQV